MTKSAVVSTAPLNIATLLGTHEDNGFLFYVQEGTIETDAVVDVHDPKLKLFVSADLIETGNSLVWLTHEQLLDLDVKIELHKEDTV